MAYAPGELAAILKGIGAPVTGSNLNFMRSWARAEGGSATFNPFNTTQNAKGATSYNSNGGDPVKNYTNEQQGINATVQTLRNGLYGGIINPLIHGGSAMSAAQGLAASKWGTGALVEKILAGGGAVPAAATNPATPAAVAPVNSQPSTGGGRQSLIQQVMARNTQYATTGTLAASDPAVASASVKGGIPNAMQDAIGNVRPGQQSVPGKVGAIIQTAMKFQGVPYVWGGESKQGFDCSGLIQYIYAQHGINLPRSTFGQITQGSPVSKNHLQPGDLVFSNWDGGSSPEHVVMYIGNGKVIAAPHTGAKVGVEPLSLFTGSHYVGARRIVH